ncbi:MAG: hypothetical protein KME20_03525 [Kaiparowitsia implicata GSE-PSE-MK54-09C]|jgi:hypothetical protein|nr:hypothetical protein [Kaiparowitsia implicata GSE-PSE-MK54-09C]
MSQPNLIEQAKHGDPQAIATLMNRTLQPRGMSAAVERQGDRLQVKLEGQYVPNRQVLVAFVKNGVDNLAIETIQTVEVLGQEFGAVRPAWSEELQLTAGSSPSSASASISASPPLTSPIEPTPASPVDLGLSESNGLNAESADSAADLGFIDSDQASADSAADSATEFDDLFADDADTSGDSTLDSILDIPAETDENFLNLPDTNVELSAEDVADLMGGTDTLFGDDESQLPAAASNSGGEAAMADDLDSMASLFDEATDEANAEEDLGIGDLASELDSDPLAIPTDSPYTEPDVDLSVNEWDDSTDDFLSSLPALEEDANDILFGGEVPVDNLSVDNTDSANRADFTDDWDADLFGDTPVGETGGDTAPVSDPDPLAGDWFGDATAPGSEPPASSLAADLEDDLDLDAEFDPNFDLDIDDDFDPRIEPGFEAETIPPSTPIQELNLDLPDLEESSIEDREDQSNSTAIGELSTAEGQSSDLWDDNQDDFLSSLPNLDEGLDDLDSDPNAGDDDFFLADEGTGDVTAADDLDGLFDDEVAPAGDRPTSDADWDFDSDAAFPEGLEAQAEPSDSGLEDDLFADASTAEAGFPDPSSAGGQEDWSLEDLDLGSEPSPDAVRSPEFSSPQPSLDLPDDLFGDPETTDGLSFGDDFGSDFESDLEPVPGEPPAMGEVTSDSDLQPPAESVIELETPEFTSDFGEPESDASVDLSGDLSSLPSDAEEDFSSLIGAEPAEMPSLDFDSVDESDEPAEPSNLGDLGDLGDLSPTLATPPPAVDDAADLQPLYFGEDDAESSLQFDDEVDMGLQTLLDDEAFSTATDTPETLPEGSGDADRSPGIAAADSDAADSDTDWSQGSDVGFETLDFDDLGFEDGSGEEGDFGDLDASLLGLEGESGAIAPGSFPETSSAADLDSASTDEFDLGSETTEAPGLEFDDPTPMPATFDLDDFDLDNASQDDWDSAALDDPRGFSGQETADDLPSPNQMIWSDPEDESPAPPFVVSPTGEVEVPPDLNNAGTETANDGISEFDADFDSTDLDNDFNLSGFDEPDANIPVDESNGGAIAPDAPRYEVLNPEAFDGISMGTETDTAADFDDDDFNLGGFDEPDANAPVDESNGGAIAPDAPRYEVLNPEAFDEISTSNETDPEFDLLEMSQSGADTLDGGRLDASADEPSITWNNSVYDDDTTADLSDLQPMPGMQGAPDPTSPQDDLAWAEPDWQDEPGAIAPPAYDLALEDDIPPELLANDAATDGIVDDIPPELLDDNDFSDFESEQSGNESLAQLLETNATDLVPPISHEEATAGLVDAPNTGTNRFLSVDEAVTAGLIEQEGYIEETLTPAANTHDLEDDLFDDDEPDDDVLITDDDSVAGPLSYVALALLVGWIFGVIGFALWADITRPSPEQPPALESPQEG